MKHLIIPDSHAKPDETLRRYEYLGELIMMERPDVIIDIGDWYDMPSLCSYDRGTAKFHNAIYQADIEAGKEAERLAFSPIVEHNKKSYRQHRKRYKPLIIRCKGNHENRINTAINQQHELDGILSDSHTDLHVEGLNVINVPFLEVHVQDDIAYTHYRVSGVMGRPVSSARALLNKAHMSITMGHAHTKDTAEDVRADGTRS